MVTLVLKDPTGKILLELKGANADETIIEQLEQEAFDMPYSCRAGSCITCAVIVLKGKKHINEQLGGEKFIETDDDQILTCIAGLREESVEAEEEYMVELEMIDFY